MVFVGTGDSFISPDWSTQITRPTHERVRHSDHPAVGWLRPTGNRGRFVKP